MIQISKTKNDSAEYARKALLNRLFVPGWELSSYLQAFKKKEIKGRVALAVEDGAEIGVAIYIDFDDRLEDYDSNIMVYVKSKYRHLGIGAQLIRSLRPPKYTFAGKGIDGSLSFWQKMGIKCI